MSHVRLYQLIPQRRRIARLLLRRPVRLFDLLNGHARHLQWQRRQEVPQFAHRFDLYRYLVEHVMGDEPIDFLEFGVYEGESIFKWAELNRHPDSRFVGFDSFEGLPESWENFYLTSAKGAFTTKGAIPATTDRRIRFVKGWFQEVLPEFLRSFRPRSRIVLHNDSDLYASTLYTLTTVAPILGEGTLVLFDEFADPLNEFRAFQDFVAAFWFDYTCVGAAGRNCNQLAAILHPRRP
jgi:O-methyltransferase